MIIGKGNIASALIDIDGLIFFAAGVSDSSCIDEKEFEREKKLLLSISKKEHLVYFSSLGIFRWDSRYISHKKEMEKIVKKRFDSYTIVRVEVIEWGRNKNTIHNYFRRKIDGGEPIAIQDTYRYVLDKEEFQYWISCIKIGEQHEMNIIGKKYHVCEIYKMVKDGVL